MTTNAPDVDRLLSLANPVAADDLPDARSAEAEALYARLAEQVGTTLRGPVRLRRRRVLALAAAAAVVAVAALLLPTRVTERGRVDVVERALAGVSTGPVLHAVLELPQRERMLTSEPLEVSVVDLTSGHTRPAMSRIELWYDPNRRLLRQTNSIEGAVVFERLQTPDGVHDRRGSRESPGAPQIDPSLAAFFTGYREALEEGSATVVGSDVVDGRNVQWLRFPPSEEGWPPQEVAVDSESFEPQLLRTVCADCAAPPRAYRIVVLEGVGEHAADFTPPRADPVRVAAFGGGRRQITASEAETELGRPALWAGRELGGLRLDEVQLVTPTMHSASPPTRENRIGLGRGLQVIYGEAKRGEPRLAIGQAEDYRFLFGSFNFNNAEVGVPLTIGHSGVPPEGEVALTGGGAHWTAQLRKDGLFVEIDGPSRELVLEAARSLRRIEP
jgi:hypothetical protein